MVYSDWFKAGKAPIGLTHPVSYGSTKLINDVTKEVDVVYDVMPSGGGHASTGRLKLSLLHISPARTGWHK